MPPVYEEPVTVALFWQCVMVAFELVHPAMPPVYEVPVTVPDTRQPIILQAVLFSLT